MARELDDQLVPLIQPELAVMLENEELVLTWTWYWMLLAPVEALQVIGTGQDEAQVLGVTVFRAGVVGAVAVAVLESLKVPVCDQADTSVVATLSRACTRQ